VPGKVPRLRLEGRLGELLDSGMRMCLLDVETSFYGLRKSVEGVVGEAASILFYDSGVRGGMHYAEALLRSHAMKADEAGYREAVHGYSEGGFGAFEIRELDFARGKGRLVCRDPMAFEAYAAVTNHDPRKQPVCDFSRGVLVGLLAGFSGRTDLGCYEETCRATGAAECLFRIDKEVVTRAAAISRNLSRAAAPR
jgi:predicted hydrocarbon binding protein